MKLMCINNVLLNGWMDGWMDDDDDDDDNNNNNDNNNNILGRGNSFGAKLPNLP